MITAPVITAGLNAIVLALTPLERWEAMRWFNSNFMTERWFIITGVLVIIILTVLLFVVSSHRTAQEQRATNQLFVEYAEKRGLSRRERQILLDIASKAGLKRSEAIFTMGNAFDRGAAKTIEKTITQQKTEESTQLKSELSFLREKLGFQKPHPSSIGSPTKPKRLSSRQIPVGKKLHITRRKTPQSDSIESTVIKNDDMELVVKLAMSIESTAGEFWRARYSFGASVWEFDTSVVSCSGDILFLNHSDNIRFINRRRFLRVPVNKPAFIAHFPFTTTSSPNIDSSKEGSEAKHAPASNKRAAPGSTWGPPEFIPAVVTELAGPGLRVEAALEVKVGDRVLVVFRLDEGKGQNSMPARRQDDKASTPKVIEDVGEVRHTKTIQNGLSIAVELIGLSDSDVNELIRATNAASVRAGTAGQDTPDSVNAERSVPEPEPAAVQGV